MRFSTDVEHQTTLRIELELSIEGEMHEHFQQGAAA